MPAIEYELPNEIDGEAPEVEAVIRDQLRAIAPAIAELCEQSATQLRGAWMSAAIDADPSVPNEELVQQWQDAAERKEIERLKLAGAYFLRAAQRV